MNFKTISFQNANGETLSGRLDLPLGAVPDAYARFAHCFRVVSTPKRWRQSAMP